MAKTRSQARLYEELADRYGRAVADAFFRALDDIRSAAEIQRLTAAIEAGQIEEALDALHIDPEAYEELLDRIREAHTEGGRAAVETMPARRPDGTALVVRFSGRNLIAEAQVRDHGARLVTRTTEDQRQAVRNSIRASLEEGVNPRTAALRIVGTLNRQTGKREGGILGLTAAQEAYVRNARAELASGDPAALRAYLGRTRRDKRFDRTILKAIREEQPVPAETARKAVLAYERRLLQLRGETIGRVEAMTALQQGRFEAYRQAVESGAIPENAVRKVWRSAGDFRVRHTHRALNGDTAGLNEAFRSPSGARLRFPMDTALGAPADEIVNCRCDAEYRVDWLANLR